MTDCCTEWFENTGNIDAVLSLHQARGYSVSVEPFRYCPYCGFDHRGGTKPGAAKDAYDKHLAENGLVKVPREPTEAMLANGVSVLIDGGLDGPDGVGHSDANGCWEAMIDAYTEKTDG